MGFYGFNMAWESHLLENKVIHFPCLNPFHGSWWLTSGFQSCPQTPQCLPLQLLRWFCPILCRHQSNSVCSRLGPSHQLFLGPPCFFPRSPRSGQCLLFGSQCKCHLEKRSWPLNTVIHSPLETPLIFLLTVITDSRVFTCLFIVCYSH